MRTHGQMHTINYDMVYSYHLKHPKMIFFFNLYLYKYLKFKIWSQKHTSTPKNSIDQNRSEKIKNEIVSKVKK